jgi:hypothetical protein
MFDRVFGYLQRKAAMDTGNTNCFEVRMEQSRGTKEHGKDEPTTLSPRLERISHEILRDLGMTDDAIAEYFCRFGHGQTERFVQMVMRKQGWMCNSWRGRMSNEGAAAWPKRSIT